MGQQVDGMAGKLTGRCEVKLSARCNKGNTRGIPVRGRPVSIPGGDGTCGGAQGAGSYHGQVPLMHTCTIGGGRYGECPHPGREWVSVIHGWADPASFGLKIEKQGLGAAKTHTKRGNSAMTGCSECG